MSQDENKEKLIRPLRPEERDDFGWESPQRRPTLKAPVATDAGTDGGENQGSEGSSGNEDSGNTENDE